MSRRLSALAVLALFAWACGGIPGVAIDPDDGAVADSTADASTDSTFDVEVPDTSMSDAAVDSGADSRATDAGDASDGSRPADALADATDAAADVFDAAPDAFDASVCIDGEKGCTGSVPETCVGGQWVSADAGCAQPTPVCQADAGACTCPGAVCTGTCTDETSDPLNCGSCGNVCAISATCLTSVCTCPIGQMACSGRCVDTSRDVMHCGSCVKACLMGQSCASGFCF